MRARINTIICLGCLFWTLSALAEVFFIPLKHVPSQQLIPIVKPFLNAGDSVVPGHQELILRTDPKTLADIERIVRQYDQALPQLMIYVRTQRDRDNQEQGVKGHIDAQVGSKSVIRGKARVYSNRDRHNDNSQRFIQVMDGHPAYISFGRRTPYSEIQVYEGPYDIYLSSTTRFDEATSGFTVTPHLVGNQVQLSIEPWSVENSRVDGEPQSISSASTTIRVDLDRWITIGGQMDSNRDRQHGLTSRQYSTRSATEQIEVKVSHLMGHP